jgi:flagellum-specific peptidoglycan hydrolase FlgJ
MNNDEQQRQFNEFLEQAGRLSPDVVATMAAISNASGPINKMRYSISDASHELQKYKDTVSNLSEEELKHKDSITKLTEAEAKQLQAIVSSTAAFNALKNTLGSFGSALMDTSHDVSKYTGTFKTMGDGAVEVGNTFGKAGQAIGHAVKAITVAAESILKYNSAIIKAFDDLADIGAVTQLSSNEIRDLGANANFTTHTLGTFTKNAKSLDTTLIALGGSASGGVKAFSDFSAIGKDQLEQFRRLGYTQEQVNEMQTAYIKQVSGTGAALAKTPQMLQKESLEYIKSLQILAEITGIDAKKQQEGLAFALANENFAAHIMDLQEERAENMKKAEAEADPIRKAQYHAEAERLQNSIKAKEEYASVAKATRSAADATAILETISTKGAIVYTENNSNLALQNRAMQEQVNALNQGKKQTFELLADDKKVRQEFKQTFGDFTSSMGASSKENMKLYGQSVESMKAVADLDKMTAAGRADFIKRQTEIERAQDEKAKGKPDDKGNTDVRMNAAAAAQTVEITAREWQNKLIELIDPFSKSTNEAALATGLLAAAAAAAAGALSFLAGQKVLSSVGDLLKGAAGRGNLPGTGGTAPPGGGGGAPVAKPTGGLTPDQKLKYDELRKQGMSASEAKRQAGGFSSLVKAEEKIAGAKPVTDVAKPVPIATAKPVADIAGDAAKIAEAEAAAAKAAGATSKLATAGKYLSKLAGPLATVTSVVGGGLTAYQGVNEATKDLAEGKITKGEATVKKSEAAATGAGQVVGGVGGAALGGKIGTAAGGAIGALFGGVGAVPGAVIGGFIGTALGGWLGSSGGEKIGKMAGNAVGEKIKESDQSKTKAGEMATAKEEREAKEAEKLNLLEAEKLHVANTTNTELQTLSKNIEILNKSMISSTNQLLALTKSVTNLNTTIDFGNADSATQIKKFEEIANKLGLSQRQIDEVKKRLEDAASKKEKETTPEGGKPGALKGESKEFYSKMYATLLEEAKKAKVANPEAVARLGAAQASLETGYGKSTAGGNNYFGIKGKKGDTNVSQVDTQEWDPKQGKMVTVKAGFRKYGSMQESAADYIKFLQENPRYKDVLNAKNTQEAIQAQGKTGYATDPNYASKLASINAKGFASESTEVAAAPAPRPIVARTSASMLTDAGLKIKKGDVQADGAELDPRLIEIAKEIQAQVPNFMQFTGFNDQFHQENAPGSLHAKGRAFDFVLAKKPTKEEGARIVSLMKSLGIDYAQDEYNNPSAKATAGHFHGQIKDRQAYDGGIFDGPKAGFNVELHGREAVVPLPNPESVITVDDGVKKDPLSTVMSGTNPQMANLANIQLPGMDQLAGITEAMMKMMEDKFDDMIDKLESSNTIQEKIYRNSST